MPAFREDQLFIIAPGSATTLAQLGLLESFSPPRHHIPSRMFRAAKAGEFEAIKVRKKVKEGGNTPKDGGVKDDDNDEAEWEEDISQSGAVWPIQHGRIVDWPCFFALMTHVYNMVNPPFHTPVIIVAEPVWTVRDHERITQFFFEKFKVPAFSMIDSASAVAYAYNVSTATIVDIGLDKADVTCITDYTVHEIGRTLAMPGCGGEAMTQHLLELLRGRDFDHEMCEQLKKSPICEILSPEQLSEVPSSDHNPTTVAALQPPAVEVTVEKRLEDDEGVLDIASIVTGGHMNEYLAQKEREKAAKQAKKGAEAALPPAKLANHKRIINTFLYENIPRQGVSEKSNTGVQGGASTSSDKLTETGEASQDKPSPGKPQENNREIEVGTERFSPASPSFLNTLTSKIYLSITTCPVTSRRGELWENIIITGQGSRVPGFREAVLLSLQRRFQVGSGEGLAVGGYHPTQSAHPAPPPNLYAAGGLGAGGFSIPQTPSSIKMAKVPEHFAEWKEVNYYDAGFVGAQIAARVLYASPQASVNGESGIKGFLNRIEYNDLGPRGVREILV
ncbi:actin-like ATPase domain-containing protein [Piedraia hortae CBS 480.64]|uniref:Actin-like ATPase domain-containing protein n=1 Tax=Piedraia hortae CBS 480.64 TaxID=1314780 RepID=A0A6A7BZ16_9PEZI|nr:actin-like ATPase domain-containing protein [Piedraia hortae CBS 480.64]